MIKRIRFTKSGYETVQKEYQDLLAQRPAAVEDLKKARELGDLSENGYYKASRARLSFIDSQLRRLSLALKQAVVVATASSDTIVIGSKVRLSFGDKEVSYEIVGDLEANPAEGKISLLSPLGKALEGKRVGEEVKIVTPIKTTKYKILEVS